MFWYEHSIKVKRSLEKLGFAKTKIENKEPGQIWSLSKLYLRGPDIRRIHVRGFKDGSIKCEDETLWPDHFRLVAKPGPCFPQIIKKIEENGYKCLDTDDASWCMPSYFPSYNVITTSRLPYYLVYGSANPSIVSLKEDLSMNKDGTLPLDVLTKINHLDKIIFIDEVYVVIN